MERLSNKQFASNPDLTSTQENSANITQRLKRKQPECELMAAIAALQSSFTSTLQDLRSDLGTKIDNVTSSVLTVRNDLESYQAVMQKELEHLRSEQTDIKKKLRDLTNDVSDIQTSTQFISDQHDELNKKVSACSKQIINTSELENSITSLELKIDALEQQARQCNIEIQNLPEKKNENLINLVVNLGEKIRCTINRSDIVSIHRVRHATENSKPKHVIVKLSSRMLRDNVLAASRAKGGLTSADLGIPGTQHTLYINEHLTLRRKRLFRAAREAAKRANFKHKWTSNGTILVRASDSSPSIIINTEKDIEKIIRYEDPVSEISHQPTAGTSEVREQSVSFSVNDN